MCNRLNKKQQEEACAARSAGLILALANDAHGGEVAGWRALHDALMDAGYQTLAAHFEDVEEAHEGANQWFWYRRCPALALLTVRQRLEAQLRTDGVFRGAPSFFRASCREVAMRRVNVGYEYAGQQLARRVAELIPDSLDENDWFTRVQTLEDLADGDDLEGMKAWLCHHFPRCMAEVPARRRDKFVAGIIEYASEQQLIS